MLSIQINAAICLATHLSCTYALLSIPVYDVIPGKMHCNSSYSLYYI